MIKVASYCRVSTDKEDQTNSFEAQQRYFREYIEHQPDWELYRVYADEGITGTSTRKRTQFNRMINDAYDGKFQLIITKEVSRFSRNILDTISYTRELKAIGVGVRFVIDGINTMNPDAELYLSIMASMAQEESRKTSSRVIWGQTRQMEKGIVFGQSLLGYDVEKGRIHINPDGAEIVRLIFQKYAIEQVGTSNIAKFLTNEGYCTYRGSTKWKPGTIVKILKNEKYVGDLIQRKSYTPDYLSHEKKRNTGQVPLVCIRNHHEPIISREVWDMAQERLRKNNKHAGGNSGHSNRYVFSGKIKCGECGASYVGRIRYRKDGSGIRRWSCSTAAKEGTKGCSVGKLVPDDDAMQMLKAAIRSLQMDAEAVINYVSRLALDAIHTTEQGSCDDPKRLQNEIDRIRDKKTAAMDSYFSGDITKEDMLSVNRRYDQQIEVLDEQLHLAEISQKSGTNADQLRDSIQSLITSILRGKIESEVFLKNMLHSLTVFRDRHMELRLNYLPQVFRFVE